MKIESVRVTEFTYPTRRSVDSAGHSHPGPPGLGRMALLTISTAEGHQGHAFAAPEVIRSYVIESYARKVLTGLAPGSGWPGTSP